MTTTTFLVMIISFGLGFALALLIATIQTERDYKEMSDFIYDQAKKEFQAREKIIIERHNTHSIDKANRRDYFNSF